MSRIMGSAFGLLLTAGLLLGLGACSADGAYDNDGYNRAPHHHYQHGEGPGSKH